ncbi:Ig-like domain repeat protein [Fimbriiglobus ruber]|uniref:Putative internalin n=1 Tax=Fimbriiglobus ruber TaxID=1908690 RepID=A0A225DVM6_9BACT|nr:Ig-like domain repeat protein [Fimbriiglobus ruber]OWK45590.1 putative internalin [Fimbriiglobus ruber]
MIAAGTGTVTLQPRTPGTLVSLGGDDATGSPITLGLSAADLAQITAGTLVIGSAAAATITVAAPLNLTATAPTLDLVTGGAIVNGASAGTALTVTNLSLSAAAGIGTSATPLTTSVGTLAAANATSGGVAVTNVADFTVGTVGSVAGVTATGQAVSLTATSGTLTVSAPIAATGPAGSVTLTAGQSVDVAANVTGGGGGVQITGSGLAAEDSTGVIVEARAMVTTTDNGAVKVTGTGGAGSGVFDFGVDISGTVTSGATGAVTVTGTGGGGSGDGDVGVDISGTVTSGATGAVTVTGTGGGGSGDGDIGVEVYGTVTSGGTGAVAVTGIGGAGGGKIDYGIFEGGMITTASTAAPITLTTDSLSLTPISATSGNTSISFGGSTGTINSGTGTTTIQPRTPGTLVALGGDDVLTGVPLTLGLSTTDLAQITAGTLVVGNATAGTITVAAPLNLTATAPTLDLVTGGAIVNGVSVGTALTVTNLSLSAVAGIGSAATPLTTSVGTLAATNTTSGGVAVTNAADFTVGTVGSVAGVTATGQAVSLTATSGTLTVSAPIAATGPAGSVTLTAGQSVDVAANVTGGGGGVQITGSGLAAVDSTGVTVEGGMTVTTTDSGAVTITGTGGAGSGGFDIGVEIEGTVTSSGTGAVTIAGTGGSAPGIANYGVFVTGALTSGGSGMVTVTGTGGTGNGNFDIGVGIEFGTITSGGGAVSVTGTGGLGTGSSDYGVAVALGATLTSGGGAVSVAGTGTSTSEAVHIYDGGTVTTALTNSTITITADSLTLTDPTYGSGTISAGTGTVTIQPQTPGTLIALGGDNVLIGSPLTLGLSAADLAQITAGTLVVGSATAGSITVAANVTLPGENLTLVTGAGVTGTGGIANGSATAATLTIDQAGTSTYAGVIGGATAADQNLALVTQGSGTLTLTGASNYTGPTAVTGGTLVVNGTLAGGGAVSVSNAAVLGGIGSVAGSVSATDAAHVAPGDGPGTLTTGAADFAPGTSFDVVIAGPAPGDGVTGYDQLAAGPVDIGTGVTLNLSPGGGYVPFGGESYTLVTRTGGTGTFAGLPEGATLPNFLGSGLTATITYQGGTGHDIVVQVAARTTTTALAVSPPTSTFGQSVTFTATVASDEGTPDGSVTFVIDGTPTAPVALVNGTAAYTTSTLAAGSHTVTAEYSGSSNFQSATSTTQTEQVNVPTSTALAAPVPSTFGQTVTFTATVSATDGETPDGSVTFVIDGTARSPVALVNGVATYTTSTLAAGSYTVEAEYTGNGNFLTSDATAITQAVNPAATATTLAVAPAPSTFGQAVTLTATVTSGGGTPDGSVTFVIDGTAGSPVTLVNGVAAYTTSTLAAGSHTVMAEYSGSSNFQSAASATQTEQVNVPTTTTLTGPPSPSSFGQSVTFTANVGSGDGTPDGSVTFVIDGTATAPVSLANGIATYTISTLAAGSHTIAAEYAGSGNFLTSDATAITQAVNTAATATTLAVAPTPSTFGQTVTVTATVISAGGTPDGTITFVVDGTPAGTVALANGVATLTMSTLAAGSHTVMAEYSGSNNFQSGTSTTQTEQVNVPTSTTLAAPEPSTFGQSVTFTATVSATDGETPDGSVTFVIDGTAITPVALVNGIATYTTSTLAAGSHTVTAEYAGNGNFLTSDATAITQAVSTAATTTTLAVAPTLSTFGQTVPFTATVASSAGTPGGSVTFVIDGATGSPVTLVNGVATYTTSTLAAGSHTVVAEYSGSDNFQASGSPTQTEQVNVAATTTTLTATPSPSQAGQSVTVTATVTGGTPGTAVAFTLDGSVTPFATAPVDATGTASVSTATIPAGSHTITATYAGDATTPSSTTSVALTVTQAPTLTGGSFPTTATVRTAFDFTVSAAGFPAPAFTVASGALPPGLTLDPATGAVTGTPTRAGTYTGVIQATNSAGSVDIPFAIAAASRPVDQSAVTAFAVSGGATPTLLNADGSSAGTGASPFGPGTTSVVVMADVTGDGVTDLIYGSGPGTPAKVVVIDGATEQVVFTFTPFEATFTGGVFVAAGDVDGDGHADIAVSADTGGSGRVIVYSGQSGSVMADFMGIADPNFRGGARVTMGDVNGDGLDDLVVAAGTGGGPRVAVFDGVTIRSGQAPTRLIPDFFAFEASLRDGAYVAIGDVNGDGIGDLVLGGGPTGGPRVLVLDGASLLASNGLTPSTLANFYAGDPSSREGVTVAVKDLGNNDQADIVVDDPAPGGAHVVAYQGSALTPSGTPTVYHDYSDAAESLGVYVG